MISADFRGDKPALDRLRAFPDAVNEGLARAVAKLGTGLQSRIRQDKLSGQVLKIRSGALKASIEVATHRSAAAVTATVSTDLDYAAAQEYGFSGTVSVRVEPAADQGSIRPPDRREDDQRRRAQPADGPSRTLLSALGARRHDAPISVRA